nr:hypothetical protein Iba_chr12cCG4090 [Ipomoea batatas]
MFSEYHLSLHWWKDKGKRMMEQVQQKINDVPQFLFHGLGPITEGAMVLGGLRREGDRRTPKADRISDFLKYRLRRAEEKVSSEKTETTQNTLTFINSRGTQKHGTRGSLALSVILY